MEVITKGEIENLRTELLKPFDENCLSDLGYDLRAGKSIFVFVKGKPEELGESYDVTIPPLARFAVESLEKVILPEDMFALVLSKVTVTWNGLTSLGTKVDPFFQDNLILIFSNDSTEPFKIRKGMKICSLMFFRYKNPPKDIKPRLRPSFLPIPAMPFKISDQMDDDLIRENFGAPVFSTIQYLRPMIVRNTRRIRRLERFRRWLSYAAFGVFTAIIGSVVAWLLTGFRI